MSNIDEVKENILKKSEEPEGLKEIKGYNFDKEFNFDELIDSYETTGFQASNLSKSIKIINEMEKEKCVMFLGYTSGMVSSGLRDIFRYLVKNKMVDVVVTTAGGIEEDIIKCLDPFLLGKFELSGKELRDKGINRIGNILVPNSRYCKFEDFLIPVLEKIDKIVTPSELIHILGKEINNEESICYWAYKNNIPIFSPAITDGSMGDMIYFFMNKNPDFKIDIAKDLKKINDISINAEKTGLVILGGGLVKHHICNANLMRGGSDYAVYINTSHDFDGSEAGAPPEEAVSWGKIKGDANYIKVFGDATIIFPLIVSKCFK
ncbi:deoxyhypusine synthase [archaeon]|nr:deoxyhypusine synthase [archaeon]